MKLDYYIETVMTIGGWMIVAGLIVLFLGILTTLICLMVSNLLGPY